MCMFSLLENKIGGLSPYLNNNINTVRRPDNGRTDKTNWQDSNRQSIAQGIYTLRDVFWEYFIFGTRKS